MRRLLASRDGHRHGGLLDESERRLLRRARSGWSEADLPLLDEARAVLVEPPTRYGHVIVDEAQDLTPMQLRMVARRAGGAFTLLGDIAQATGPVAYERWPELCRTSRAARRRGRGARHAYRVPREIMELALPLLARIAPEVGRRSPTASGPSAPRMVEADPPLAARLRGGRAAGRRGRAAGRDRARLAARRGRRARSSTTRASPCSPRARRRGWSSTT